jgi:acyl carrier protein
VAGAADVLREFIVQNFLFGDRSAPLTLDDSFSERGIVDSTGILELVAFVEESFGISVGDEEIVPENFDSIARLSQFIDRKRSGNSNAG